MPTQLQQVSEGELRSGDGRLLASSGWAWEEVARGRADEASRAPRPSGRACPARMDGSLARPKCIQYFQFLNQRSQPSRPAEQSRRCSTWITSSGFGPRLDAGQIVPLPAPLPIRSAERPAQVTAAEEGKPFRD